MKNTTPSVPALSAEESAAVKPFLDRWGEATLSYQRGMHQCATVMLSISAPLCASRQASGTSAALSAAAIVAAALSLLAGFLLLRAPARQSREALQTVLAELAAARLSSRACASRWVSTAWNRMERIAARVQLAALIAAVILLALSSVLT